jgi:hypothetical protein
MNVLLVETCLIDRERGAQQEGKSKIGHEKKKVEAIELGILRRKQKE